MIYLLLSILTSVFIFAVFKLMARNQVPVLPAIVINYTVCVVEGCLAEGSVPRFASVILEPWFLNTLIMGCIFISVFYLMALTVRYSGLAVASIANKLSLIIPVSLAYFLYDETFSALKIAGIVLAMVAVVFASYKKDKEAHAHNFGYYFYPALVLIGSGIIDTFTKWNQAQYLQPGEFNLFLICVFGTAASIGWLIISYRYFYLGETISVRTFAHGLMLGIPNYGSMYFLILTLDQPGWNSSVVFPVNNIAIVALSCLVAMVLFKEKLSRLNIAGIILSIAAIFIIMRSE